MSGLAIVAAFLALQAPPQDLSWMSGYWLDCTAGREASEIWSDPRNGLMVGYGLTSRGSRSSFEYARIEVQTDGQLALVAQPGGQPPTVFRLQEADGDKVIFANPSNDFPHRIIYQRQGERLTARIEGADDDPDRSAEWSFNKAELNSRCP